MNAFASFPCWRYRAHKASRIFNTPAELEAAGEGWYDGPAHIPVEPVVPEVVEPMVDAPVEPETEEAANASLDELDMADLRKIADEYAIEYDGRWGRVKLIAAIKAKMEPAAE